MTVKWLLLLLTRSVLLLENNVLKQNGSGNVHIGMTAPDFSANTTFGNIKLSDFKGKWVVLFSHPGDFTPVCTTEFIAFAEANPEFEKRNVQLMGLSIDSNPSHLAWVNSIFNNTGVKIPFPVIADRTGDIAKMYGMIAPDVSTQETVRNVYIIDPNQVIRAILIYPLTNGRNIYEVLRLVDALQTTDKDKVVTPANWLPGEPALVPAAKTYDELKQRQNNPQSMGLNCKDWYYCYKNSGQQP
jgi:peroxiredoxin (alkyl hydroperoxide reductase subunit C)